MVAHMKLVWVFVYISIIHRTNVIDCAGTQKGSTSRTSAKSSRSAGQTGRGTSQPASQASGAVASPVSSTASNQVASQSATTTPRTRTSTSTPPRSGTQSAPTSDVAQARTGTQGTGSSTPANQAASQAAGIASTPANHTAGSSGSTHGAQPGKVSTTPSTTPAGGNGSTDSSNGIASSTNSNNSSNNSTDPTTTDPNGTTPTNQTAGENGTSTDPDATETSEETTPVKPERIDLNIDKKESIDNIEYEHKNDSDIFKALNDHVFHKLYKGEHELKELTEDYPAYEIEVSYNTTENKILLTCTYGTAQRVVFNIPDPSKSLTPLELNINTTQTQNNVDVKTTGHDKTFTPKTNYGFNKVVVKLSSGSVSKCFYEAANASEYATKVEHRGAGQNEQKLLIYLLNGHIKKWKKLGAAAQWEDDGSAQITVQAGSTSSGTQPSTGTGGSQSTSGGGTQSSSQTAANVKINLDKSKLSVFTLKSDATEAENDTSHYQVSESGTVLDYVFKSEFKCVKINYDGKAIVEFGQQSSDTDGAQPTKGTENAQPTQGTDGSQASTDPKADQDNAPSVKAIQDHPISAQFNLEVMSVLFIMPNEEMHFFVLNESANKWEHMIDKKPVACVLDANASAGTSQYNCSTGGLTAFKRDHTSYSSATAAMRKPTGSAGAGSSASQSESSDSSTPKSDPNAAKSTQPDAGTSTTPPTSSSGSSTDTKSSSSGGSSDQTQLKLDCTSESERHFWTKPKYAFNRVKVNTFTFHETECPSEYAWKLAYTGIATNSQVITLYLLNGRTKTFNRAGDDQAWTFSESSPVTNVELDLSSEATAEYSCAKHEGTVTFTTRGAFYAFTKIKDGQSVFFDNAGGPTALKVVILGQGTGQLGVVIHLSNGTISKMFKTDSSNWSSVPGIEKDKIEFVTETKPGAQTNQTGTTPTTGAGSPKSNEGRTRQSGSGTTPPSNSGAGQGSTAKPAGGSDGTKPKTGKGSDGSQSASSEGSTNETGQTGTAEGTDPNATSGGGGSSTTPPANTAAITETTEYELREPGGVLDYKFKPGVKCVGVKYDNKDIWTSKGQSEDSTEGKGVNQAGENPCKAAVAVQFYLDLQLVLIKVEDVSLAMYDFVGSGWALAHKGMPKPVVLDVNSSQSTSQFKIVSGDSRLFTPGPGFGFKKIIGQNIIFYETKFEDEYATKVEYKGYASEKRDIEITLPSGKIMLWNKFDKHKFWKDVTIYEPIKLDIACKKSTALWEYQEALGIGTYISKVGYGFYLIYKNDKFVLNLSDRVAALQQQSKANSDGGKPQTGTQQPASQQPANASSTSSGESADGSTDQSSEADGTSAADGSATTPPANQQQPAANQQATTNAGQTSQTSSSTPTLPTGDDAIKTAQQYVARSIRVDYEDNEIALDCGLLWSRCYTFRVADPEPNTSSSSSSGTSSSSSTSSKSASGTTPASGTADGTSNQEASTPPVHAGESDGSSGGSSSGGGPSTIELDLMATTNANYTFSKDEDDYTYEAKTGVKFSKIKKGTNVLKSLEAGKEAIKVEASFSNNQIMLCIYETDSVFAVSFVNDPDPDNKPPDPPADGGTFSTPANQAST